MKEQLPSFHDAGAYDDCIAVCAPGGVLSVPLFYERIVLSPYTSPGKLSEIRIESDQLYDLLLQPETGSIDKLLFLAPTILFDDLHNASQDLFEHVQVKTILDPADSWHYPKVPELSNDNTVTVTVHNQNLKPAVPAFETYTGKLGTASVSLSETLQSINCLAAMVGLKRTVFQCVLDPPIEVGEKRWLRLRIKPSKIFPNSKLASEINPESGLAGEHNQILDVLGADALLESLRDTLQNSLKSESSAETKLAISDLLAYTFTHGFEKAGTYTLISDHRITLTAKDLKIQPPATEGSIRLTAIALIKELGVLGYHWHGGLRFHWKHDPLIVARRIYEHARKYAFSPETAKSKEEYTYATSVNHRLGCEVIDILANEPWCFFRSNNTGRTFYLDPQKHLSEDSKLRYADLVKIANRVVEKIRPAKAHFRIFFEARWKQLAEDHKKLVRRRHRRENINFWLAILSFILAIGAIIIALRPPASSTTFGNSNIKTNELNKTGTHR